MEKKISQNHSIGYLQRNPFVCCFCSIHLALVEQWEEKSQFIRSSAYVLASFHEHNKQQHRICLHFHNVFTYFDIIFHKFGITTKGEKSVFMLKCELSMRSFFVTIWMLISVKRGKRVEMGGRIMDYFAVFALMILHKRKSSNEMNSEDNVR